MSSMHLEPDEELCSNPQDDSKTHCMNWWDGDECHWCGKEGLTDDDKRELGMEVSDE